MKREQLERAMDQLAEVPQGGIGVDGPTLKELEAIEEQGHYCEDDANYHIAQKVWRMLERLLPQCRQNWKEAKR